MRLGAQTCQLVVGTKSHQAYGKDRIVERHRQRYEINNENLEPQQRAGHTIAGRSEDGSLVEMLELDDHPWFVACQFHPEFKSTPRDGHPLFTSFVRAARAQRAAGRQIMKLCHFEAVLNHPLFLIAGPCVIESESLALETARMLKEITARM